MDEEQTLESPLAGSLRGIRRSVSSSVFNPVSRPQTPETDATSNNLLQQNQLALSNISNQLEGITKTVTSLNFSLQGIKENLAVSDTLEKQRENEKQRREDILAEQGLREGKESALEKKIQSSLQKPLQGIAGKTQKALFSLQRFFLILAGGWLTNVGIDLLQAIAEGNQEKIKKLKLVFTAGLVGLGATVTAISIGIGNTLRIITRFAASAGRIAFGGFLRGVFTGVRALFSKTLTLVAKLAPILLRLAKIPFGLIGKLLAGLGIFAGAEVSRVTTKKGAEGLLNMKRVNIDGKEKIITDAADDIAIEGTKKGKGFFKNLKNPFKGLFNFGAKETVKQSTKNIANKGLKGLLQKLAAPFKGKGGFIGAFLIDFLIFGEDFDKALAGAAGFIAGAKLGSALGGFLGAFIGGIGAVPGAAIGGIIGGLLGPSIMKNLYEGVKGMFGFGKNKKNKLSDPDLRELTGDDLVGEREAVELGLIEPVQVDNSSRADLISQDPDDTPNILSFNQAQKMGGLTGNMPVEGESSQIPFIPFDEENTAALFATSTFGAPG